MNVIISNSVDNQDNYSAEALQREFTIYVEPLGNRRQLVRSVGWPITDVTRQILDHKIRVVTKADPTNPERAAGPLVYALRETAAKSREHVGKAVLFASLPRCAVPSPAIITGPMTNLDFRRRSVSLFLPDTVRNPRDAAVYVPALIGPHGATIGVKIYAGPAQPKASKRDGY